MSAVDIYTLVIVHLAAIPATLFPLVYSRSPWRSTDVGRALMLKGSALAALFDVSILGFWWPFPGYVWIYAALVTLVALGITYQFVVMFRLQRQGRHHVSPHGEF